MKIKLLLTIFGVIQMLAMASPSYAQWTSVYSQTANCFAIVGDKIFAGGYANFVVSNDSGRYWNQRSAIFSNCSNITSLAGNQTTLFAGTDAGLFQSTNSGFTWDKSSYPYSNTALAIAVRDSTILVGGVRSSDNGKSWATTNLNEICNVIVEKSSTFFAGTDSGVFRSTDDGITWSKASSGIPVDIGYDIGIDGLTVLGQTLIASDDGHIYSSSNDGESWVRVDTGSGLVNVEFLAASETVLFGGVGGHAGTISCSLDKGITWRDVGGPDLSNTIIVWGRYILVGTNFQILRSIISGLFVDEVKNSASLPNLIQLSPNPTSGVLSIHNSSENLISISIVNALGNKVIEVAIPHSGDFSIDISNLPSGVYYARFISPNSLEIRKIIKI